MTQHHRLEVQFTINLQSGETSADHYGEFSITAPNYELTVNHKKSSSADLTSFDLPTLLNGASFQGTMMGILEHPLVPLHMALDHGSLPLVVDLLC